MEGDNVFQYAQRVLLSLITAKHPNFPKRIQSVNQRESRPVRILSLCSGAAGIEKQIIAKAGCPVQITLFDLNEKLMREAAASLSSIAETSGFLGDVNSLSVEQFGDATFDIVMFVSGLHHVVEIEHVLQGVIELLVPNGEFWIIGEAIGRTEISYGLKRYRRRIWYFRLFRSVTAKTRLPPRSILPFQKQISPPAVLKEFAARRSSRCYCDTSIRLRCGEAIVFCGVW